MEKEEIIKRLEELDKKKHSPITKYAREHLEKGEYVQAFTILFDVSRNYRPHEAEAKEVAKLIGGLYMEKTLKEARKTAENDRISAKISLIDVENRAQKMEMALPPEYEETRKFVYGLAPDQNEADEKRIMDVVKKQNLDTALKMLRFAKEDVRTGHTDNVEVMLNAVKMTAEAFLSPLPPEYPEDGDWKNAWKDEALEHVKDCVKEAQKYANEAHGNKAAKSSLDEAKDYASQFGLELPSEYEDVLKLVEEKERKKAEEREQQKKLREDSKKRSEETVKEGLSLHLSIVKEFEKSGYRHDIATTRRYLEDTKSIAENGKFPLPPEYDELLKLVDKLEKDQKEKKVAKPAKPQEPAVPDGEGCVLEDLMKEVSEDVEEARKMAQMPYGAEAAKIFLEMAETYAKSLNVPLPPDYNEVRKLVNEKLSSEEHEALRDRPKGPDYKPPAGLDKFMEGFESHAIEDIINNLKKSKGDAALLKAGKICLESLKKVAELSEKPPPPVYQELEKAIKDAEKKSFEKFGEDHEWYITQAREYANAGDHKGAKELLDTMKSNYEAFDVPLTPEYEAALKIVGEVEKVQAERRLDKKEDEEIDAMLSELGVCEEGKVRTSKAPQAKALAEPKGKAEADSEDRFVEICIKDAKKYVHRKDGVWMAKTSLESARTYAKSLGLPLPPEYDEAVKYVQEVERAAEAGTRKAPQAQRHMTHDEVYGLRKELEKSGHPKHAKAVEELRKGHYATAALLINTAEELDNVHVPSETLEPLYEEAVRDLLNGALAFENDPLILRSMLEDVKKYVSKVKELPEDLAALYEFLRKKAEGNA